MKNTKVEKHPSLFSKVTRRSRATVVSVAGLISLLILLTTPSLSSAVTLGPSFSACEGAGCRTGAYPEPGVCFNQDVGAFNNTTRDNGLGVLVGGDYIARSSSAEVEGRLVVLGNFIAESTVGLYNIGGAGAGSCVTPPNGGDAMLVGGTYTVEQGADTRISEVNIPTTFSQLRTGDEIDANLRGVRIGTPPPANVGALSGNITGLGAGDPIANDAGLAAELVPLAAQLTAFQSTSACFADTTDGVVGTTSGSLTFDGGGNDGLIVFNVPGDINGTINYTNIGMNATVLINMTGSGTVTVNTVNHTNEGVPAGTGGFTGFGDLRRRILWNFPTATNVILEGTAQYEGTLLIPNGDLFVNVPGHNGRVIVGGDLTHARGGSELHNYDFIGDDLPDCSSVTPPTGNVSVGDFVWFDDDRDGIVEASDGNGVQDPDEQGIGGVTVNLLDSSNTVINTTTTDQTGKYFFATDNTDTPLPPAEYGIEVVPPAGLEFTLSNQGGDDSVDSDVDTVTGRSGLINVPSDTSNLTFDAGLVVEVAGSCDGPDDLGGNVFRDFNADGEDQGDSEPAFNGITVNAYNNDNVIVASTTVLPDGTYNFENIFDSNDHIRLEFENLPDFMQAGSAGANSGTTTQFHQAGACDADLSVANPGEYCEEDPNMGVACYANGDPGNGGVGSLTAFKEFTYDSSGLIAANPVEFQNATAAQIGSTWGTTFHRGDGTVLLAAMLKRHTGLYSGADTTNPISTIFKANSGDNSSGAVWLDGAAVGINADVSAATNPVSGVSAVPDNATRDLTGPTDVSQDADAFPLVGKVGYGDMDISDDDKTVYVVNLADRKLYAIDYDSVTNPTTATFSSIDIPLADCENGESRPWGLDVHDGKVFVGSVCSGETEAQTNVNNLNTLGLTAQVYEMTPDADPSVGTVGVFNPTPVLSFDLDYDGVNNNADKGCTGSNEACQWTPWLDVYSDAAMFTPYQDLSRPQPILSDMVIDEEGFMILGFTDRSGHQLGWRNLRPNGQAGLIRVPTGGDILLASPNDGGGWSIEQNAVAGSRTGTGTGAGDPDRREEGGPDSLQGPDDGEFFADEFINSFHAETAQGGLAYKPGSTEVATIKQDPFTVRSAGISFSSLSNGLDNRSYEIFPEQSQTATSSRFGKAGSLGDIELLCAPAPIEIGNRVWNDADMNGVQDPCENPIANVEVQLYEWNDDGDGIYQAGELGTNTGVTATTNASGEYYFGPRTGSNVGTIALQPNTKYVVAIEDTQTALSNFPQSSPLTTEVADGAVDETNTGTSTATNRRHDSDGLTGLEADLVIAPVMTGVAGQNDHTFDFGFFGSDLGDAPDSYGTLLASNGPIHPIVDGLTIGAEVDNESDGAPNAAADGDDTAGTPDDEDGLTFSATNPQPSVADSTGSPTTSYSMDVDVTNSTGEDAFLVAYIDFNGDGDFNDPGEQSATTTVANGATTATVDFTGITGIVAGDTYVRLRLSSEEDGITTPGGVATDGEIEDHPIEILPVIGLQKILVPSDGNTDQFTFDIGANELSNTVGNGFLSEYVPLQTDPAVSISETSNTGNASYVSQAVCVDGNGANLYTGSATSIDAGDSNSFLSSLITPLGNTAAQNTITCTFTNTNLTTVAVVKAATPADDTDFSFIASRELSGTGTIATSFMLDGETTDSDADTNLPSHGGINQISAMGTFASGAFTLTELTPPAGWALQSVSCADVASGGSSQVVDGTVNVDGSGSVTVDIDDGDTITCTFNNVELVSLGSVVFLDNGSLGNEDDAANGIQDTGELGIPGVMVTLLDSNSVPVPGVPMATTGPDGEYNFNDLLPGDYRVRVVLPAVGASYVPTPTQNPNPNDDINLDSNIETINDPTPATPAFGVDSEYISGLISLSPGEEPADANTTSTEGSEQTPDSATDQPGQDTFPDENGNMTLDFGFVELVSVGSTVWFDENANGIQDDGELPIADATVTLLDSSGSPVAGVATTTTNANGEYNFNGLFAGDYRVQVDLSSATDPVAGVVLAADLAASLVQEDDPNDGGAAASNADSNIDSAAPGNDPANSIYQSGIVTLTPGLEPTTETDPIVDGGGSVMNDQPGQDIGGPNEIPDANGNMTVDFGFYVPMSLGSTLWFDSNADGLQTSGEPGIEGATVTLLDGSGGAILLLNGPDGIPGNADDGTGVVTTNADGEYNFNGLVPGDYSVRVDLTAATVNGQAIGSDLDQAPFQQAEPDAAIGDDINNDSNIADASPGTNEFTSGVISLMIGMEVEGETDGISADGPDQPNQDDIADNNGNMTLDMGFIAPVSLGSTVWEDLDGDGIQDDNEFGIEGVTITLLNEDGTVYDADPNTATPDLVTTTTNSEGEYLINTLPGDLPLPPGNYRVQVEFGNVNFPTGTDLFPSPVQNATPDNDDNTDSNLDAAQDADPNDDIYTSGIISLIAGSEPENEVDPIDGDDAGGDVSDSPVLGDTVADNSGNMTLDFGFVRPVSLGSTIFVDVPDTATGVLNGIQDADDLPIAGATVTLLDDEGTPVAGVTPFVTNDDGEYFFNDLAPGSYRVQVDLATATSPANATTLAPTPIQQTDPNDDNEVDSNVDRAIDTNPDDQVHFSGLIELITGAEPETETDLIDDGVNPPVGDADQPGQGAGQPDASGNMTLDMGFFEPVSLGSTIWFDNNVNGLQDAGEDPVVGATVTLFVEGDAGLEPYDSDPDTAVVEELTDITDGDGQYNFNALPPGLYAIEVDVATATSHTGSLLRPTVNQVMDPEDSVVNPEDYNNLDSNIAGSAGTVHTSGLIVLTQATEPVDEQDPIGTPGDDQPNQLAAQPDANGNMTLDMGFIAPVSLGSLIWEDANGNGLQDDGEAPIEGAVVMLLNADGSDYDSDLTNATPDPVTFTTLANGLYNFNDLRVGDYRVKVDLSGVTDGADLFPTTIQQADPEAGVVDASDYNNVDSNIDTAFDTDATDRMFFSGVISLSPGDEPESEVDTIVSNGVDPDQPNQTLGDDPDGNPDSSGNMTLDMGFTRPVSLGSTVWEDANRSGTQDDNELPIVGATVTLIDDSGATIPGVAPVVTDANGQYNFNNLSPGQYRVQVDVSTVPGPSTLIPSPDQNADPQSGPDQLNTDSNIDDTFAFPSGSTVFTSGLVTLVVGDEPTSEVDPIDDPNVGGDQTDQPNQGLQPLDDPDASGNMTIDFGFYSPLSIGSLVWEDTNGNGLQEPNEPPIANALVTLLLGGNPALDVNGDPIPPVTTGPDGLYLFSNLPEGDYQVLVTPPNNLLPSPVQTIIADDVANDSNIIGETALGSGTYQSPVFTLNPNAIPLPLEGAVNRGDTQDGPAGGVGDRNGNMTVDFGFVPRASIGNRVWLDLDMDGVQDANEDGIPNVTVTLTPPPGVTVDGPLTVTTGPNGEYLFPNLPPYVNADPNIGYVVTVDFGTVPTGLVQTFDEDDGANLTPTTPNNSGPIQLDPNEEHLTADFGYATEENMGALGDRVWVDANDDGVQDPGEPGIPGATVTLFDETGLIGTKTTDENGNYLFPNLDLNKTYQVVVDISTSTVPGYTLSTSGLGDPDVRDGNSTPAQADNTTFVVLTTEDPVNLDLDFGYLPPADQNNSVGDTIWRDADSDGSGPNIPSIDGINNPTVGQGNNAEADAEATIPGVTVTLVNATTNAVIATTITDANGQYLFTGVPDGNYIVRVTDQNNVLNDLDPTYDGDGVGTVNESAVDLDSTSANPDPVNDRDQDFGYVDNSTAGGDGSIGDTIFFDENDSGTPEVGEGLEGVTVQLFGPGPDGDINTPDDNVLLDTEITDENGNYLFTGLDTSDVNGVGTGTDYQVVVVTTTLPNGGDGWSNTVDPDTDPGDSTSITNLSNATPIDLDQDFGYLGEDRNTLSGTVWADADGDGIQDEDVEIGGVTIVVKDEQGNIIRQVVTDDDGNYSVTNLPDGIYVVMVTDDDNVLAPFEHTDSPNGTSDTSDQTSKDDTGYRVDLDSAGAVDTPVTDVTGDFGYEPSVTNPISLGSFSATLVGEGEVRIDWATQTEVSNVGFNMYAQVDGEWTQLNDELILSQGDSVAVQTYNQTYQTEGKVFAMGDIDLEGKETLHGPFLIGKEYGEIGERRTIDWEAELGERESKEAERERLRKEQQRQRNEERRLQQQSESSQEVSMTTNIKMSNAWINRLMTGMIAALIPTAAAADEFADDIVNFKTKVAGIHQVSYQDLMNAEVDITDEPIGNIALMNNGTPVYITVSDDDDDGLFNAGSVIRFIANEVNTLYSDTNVYTLRLDSVAALRANPDARDVPSGSAANAYLAKRKFAPQAKYSFSSPDENDPWYAASVVAAGQPASENMQINLDGFVPGGNNGGTKAKLKVNLWGGTNFAGNADDHSVKVNFNNAEVIDGSFDGLVAKQYDVPLDNVVEGNNVVNVRLPLDTGFDFDVVNVNEVEVSYPRKFEAIDNRLDFKSTFRKFLISGFTADSMPEIEDVVIMRQDVNGIVVQTNPKKICRSRGCYVQLGGTGQLAHYYVSSANALHSPQIDLLPVEQDITSEQAVYLIISHPDFIGSAGNNLLEILAADMVSEFGSAKVVDVDAVYAQFGNHIFSPVAIQNYIRYAVENLGTQYVVLVGGDVYDYRQFENENATSFIPSIYAPTGNNISFAPVDAKYVDLDNDNVPDLPIGRLPVRTTAQLASLLNKRNSYVARDYAGKILLVADEFDEIQQYDFSSDADEIEADFLQNFSVSKVYVDDVGNAQQARADVISQINQGQTLTAFFGHSSTNQWAFNGLFTGNDAANLNNIGKPTVVTQWGCWNTYYVSPNEDSMGHRFMMEGDQGAVAVMGASTLTNANSERILARMVFERIGNGERLGDAVTNAKQEYAQENPDDLDVLLGWTLLGLPDLTVN